MQTKAATSAPQHAVPALSHEGSFVVQLTGTSRPGLGDCHGRVEHILSGNWAYFASLDELLAFVDRMMDAAPSGA